MDINRANRQVADVLIQEKKTKELFLDFKTANTTTTNISGGTIIGTVSCAITNNGTLNIGIGNDGIIDNFILIIIGETYGIKNDNLFNFYDGIIKGKTAAMNGEITERELNSILVNGVDGSYKTIYLENE